MEETLEGTSVWEVGGECIGITVSPGRDMIAVAGRDSKQSLLILT